MYIRYVYIYIYIYIKFVGVRPCKTTLLGT